MKRAIPLHALTGALCIGLLSGCATAPASLYQWGGYENQLYSHFKGEPPEALIEHLEAQLQTTAASGAVPPPGLHATLGLLYTQTGRTDQAITALEREKALFPESTPYMNGLLARARK